MADSWKIGAGSGLIAGIVAGIISASVISIGFTSTPLALDFGNIPTIAIIEICIHHDFRNHTWFSIY